MLTLRGTKGSPLTHAELDANFTHLDGKVDGKADLVAGKVPAAQLPAYVDDVLEYANLVAFPGTGSIGIIYVAQDTNKTYRWSGSAYVEISPSPGSTDSVTEGSTNLYFTAQRVRDAVLAGLSTATSAAITAADSVLSAFGKLQAQITGKQDTLVSGTNIKTINGSSILGAGNIAISGGSGTPGGANKQIQYNDGGAFGAEAGFEYDAANNVMRVSKGQFGDSTNFNANSISGDAEHWVEITNAPASGAGRQLFRMNSYGVDAFGNNIHYCRYFGTESAPTAIQNGAFLLSEGFRGYDGAALSQSAGAYQVVATENWNSTSHGLRFQWEVTPNGSTSRFHAAELDADNFRHYGKSISVGGAPTTWHANYRFVQLGAPGAGVRGHISGGDLAICNNSYYDTSYRYGVTTPPGANGAAIYMQEGGIHHWMSGPGGTAGTAFTPTERMTLDVNGNLSLPTGNLTASGILNVGVTGVSFHQIAKAVTNDAGAIVAAIGSSTGNGLIIYGVNGTNGNAANAQVRLARDATTSRSINAGGTVNASGADYAEYMRKAIGCGAVAKGQIVGIDANGHVTDRWADAVHFMVKSTNPSLVGGDVWGSEEALGILEPVEPQFTAPEYKGAPHPGTAPVEPTPLPEDATAEQQDAHAMELEVFRRAMGAWDTARATYEIDQAAWIASVEVAQSIFDTATYPTYLAVLETFKGALENARQRYDRIAFSGQVPVNVLGAQEGHYIIPVQDGERIAGASKAAGTLTLSEYMLAVGRVIAIEADGRAKIIVKAA